MSFSQIRNMSISHRVKTFKENPSYSNNESDLGTNFFHNSFLTKLFVIISSLSKYTISFTGVGMFSQASTS